MAHRRAPPRRRGARRRVKDRPARLRDEGPVDRLARRRGGQERSCPGAKRLVGSRRGALKEATTCRAFTTSSSQCS